MAARWPGLSGASSIVCDYNWSGQSRITLIHSPLIRIACPIYHILNCCVQYLGTSRMVFFFDTIFVEESILAHLFTIDYDVVWVVNLRHFPLAGQHKYTWQKPAYSNHWLSLG